MISHEALGKASALLCDLSGFFFATFAVTLFSAAPE